MSDPNTAASAEAMSECPAALRAMLAEVKTQMLTLSARCAALAATIDVYKTENGRLKARYQALEEQMRAQQASDGGADRGDS